MKINIHSSWEPLLEDEFQQAYFQQLAHRIDESRTSNIIFPEEELVFEAFNKTSWTDLKVVIIGQDPYHGPQQAHGLAFSVLPTAKIPPSLRNIYTELLHDMGKLPPTHGYLMHWAEQGVLLLNTALTVEAHKAGSHSKWGWHIFTKNVLQKINEHKSNIVFILWGNHAQSIASHIDTAKHLVLKSAHPSPLSAYNGFWDSKPFSQTNQYLIQHHLTPINW